MENTMMTNNEPALSLDDILNYETPSTGSSKFKLETDVYNAIIKCLYITEAATGTEVTHLVFEANGVEKDLSLYTSFKGTKNHTKIDEKTGKATSTPDYIKIAKLCYLLTGKVINNSPVETKAIQVMDWASKGKKIIQVPCYSEMINKPVKIALEQHERFKSERNAQGVYVQTQETFTSYEINDFYDITTGQNAKEKAGGLEPKAMNTWLASNKGKVFKEKAQSIAPAAAAQPATNNVAVTSLF